MSESNSEVGCPYLGILADPETRVEHADLLNHCFRLKEALAVDVVYQEEYCVSENFNQCEVYKNENVGKRPDAINKDFIERNSTIIGLSFIRSLKDKYKRPSNIESDPDKGMEENKLPRDNDQWKIKLHDEAQSRYDEVSSSRRGKRIWGLILFLGLIMLVVFVWGAYNRYNNLIAQAQQSNNGSSQVSIATAVSEMGVAADAWATAASAIDVGSQAQATSQAASDSANEPQAVLPADTGTENIIAACEDMNSVDFVILEGPTLTPNQGYYYVAGSEKPEIQASWFVENTGNCNWESVSFLSLYDGSIISPILKKDGKELGLTSLDGKVLIEPGDRVEIVLPFDITQARSVDNEFIVLVNGISLVSHAHTILHVERWVIIISPTSQAAPVTQPTQDKDEEPPSSGPPVDRPTPTPPPH